MSIIDQVVDGDDLDPAEFAPGSFGCHEAMHEASIYAGLLSNFADHMAIVLNAEWKAEADEIAQRMADLYQRIAVVHSHAAGGAHGRNGCQSEGN